MFKIDPSPHIQLVSVTCSTGFTLAPAVAGCWASGIVVASRDRALFVSVAHPFWRSLTSRCDVSVAVRDESSRIIATGSPIYIAEQTGVESGAVADVSIWEAERFDVVLDENQGASGGGPADFRPVHGRRVSGGDVFPFPAARLARRSASTPPRLGRLVGEHVTQMGYSPVRGAGLHKTHGKIVSPIPLTPDGSVYRGCIAANITHNAQNDDAMSGGAVVDEAGEVVGLLSYGTDTNGWAVPSELVAEALEERGLLPM